MWSYEMSEKSENPLQIVVRMQVQNQTFSRALAEDVVVDDNDLHGEFIRQPEIFAWWATTTELARDRVGRLKTELARKKAAIDASVRNEAKIENERLLSIANSSDKKTQVNLVKLTETMVENMVVTHKVYMEIEDELNEAKKQLGLMMVGKEALMQKKDMLISIGANYRAEGVSNPSILKDAIKERLRRKSQEDQFQTLVLDEEQLDNKSSMNIPLKSEIEKKVGTKKPVSRIK